jgi:hypothetical protein
MDTIKTVATFATDINPIFALALTAVSLYGAVKGVQAATSGPDVNAERESFERQLQYSEEARRKNELDNHKRMIYEHTGQSPENIYQSQAARQVAYPST